MKTIIVLGLVGIGGYLIYKSIKQNKPTLALQRASGAVESYGGQKASKAKFDLIKDVITFKVRDDAGWDVSDEGDYAKGIAIANSSGALVNKGTTNNLGDEIITVTDGAGNGDSGDLGSDGYAWRNVINYHTNEEKNKIYTRTYTLNLDTLIDTFDINSDDIKYVQQSMPWLDKIKKSGEKYITLNIDSKNKTDEGRIEDEAFDDEIRIFSGSYKASEKAPEVSISYTPDGSKISYSGDESFIKILGVDETEDKYNQARNWTTDSSNQDGNLTTV